MKIFICLPLKYVLPAVTAGLFLSCECRADVTFFDGTFNNADWSETLFVNGSGGSSSAIQNPSGGNPGSYFQVTTHCNTGPACGAGIYLRNAFTHSPATQGAIFSLDYSVDLEAIAIYGEAEPVVSQNGSFYFGPELYTAAGTWRTLTEGSLTATNFARVFQDPDGELGGDGTSHPDFSASGSPVTFGFIVPDNSPAGGGIAYTTVGGVDNYTITLHVAEILAIGLTNGVTTVSWPVVAASYQLESATNLGLSAWSPVTNTPVSSGGFYFVTNQWPDLKRFFRLQAN